MSERFTPKNQERPKIRAKTPEEIQAQIATFAAEQVENKGDRRHVFKNIVDLATRGSEDMTRITEAGGEYEGQEVITPAGIERTIAAKDYTEFLRSVGGSKYEAIRGRAEILGAYKDFAPAVSELKESLRAHPAPKEHAAFLGNGSNARVFFIEKEGKKYAVRIPNREEGISPDDVDHHLAAAFLSKGVPHLEQIVAASYEDGVTVAEIMPGKEMGKLGLEDIRVMTDGQLAELVDTLTAAHKRGIHIDPKPSNFFYDRKAGFGIVDLASSKIARPSKDQVLAEIIGWAAVSIQNATTYGRPLKEMLTTEEFAQDLEISKAILHVLSHYKDVVGRNLEGADSVIALKSIDVRIQERQRRIDNYSDSDWVAGEISKAEEQRKKKDVSRESKSTDWFTIQT